MQYLIGALVILFVAVFLSRLGKPSADGGETVVQPLAQGDYPGREFVLHRDETGDFLVMNGLRYDAFDGTEVEALGYPVCDWHGRMGAGIGFAFREGNHLPVGEVYHLRVNESDVLLYADAEGGWPLSDMRLFVRQGCSLPQVDPAAFAVIEVLEVTGEMPEETEDLLRTVEDPSLAAQAVGAWLDGEPCDPPEAEDYEKFRLRVYSATEPGLYVLVTVNVCRRLACWAIEKRHFSGDTLLPAAIGEALTGATEEE